MGIKSQKFSGCRNGLNLALGLYAIIERKQESSV
jgi:hypothetical protein